MSQSFGRIKKWIQHAEKSVNLSVLAGGQYDDRIGYFVQPCIVETKDPKDPIMQEVSPGTAWLLFLPALLGVGHHQLKARPGLCDRRVCESMLLELYFQVLRVVPVFFFSSLHLIYFYLKPFSCHSAIRSHFGWLPIVKKVK